MSIVSSIPSAQYQPPKRRQTLRTREQTQPIEQPSTELYNLKDFLPQSSKISVDSRNNKSRSTMLPQSSFILKGTSHESIVQNVEERVMEQKMNKLKEANSQLQQTVDQQRFTISKQQEEINRLKNELSSIKLAEQTKAKRLAIWNYKYHAEYTPKEKYKYSLAVQTMDEGYSRSVVGGTNSLRAKDFEDIYRRLNSSGPNDVRKKKATKEQGFPSVTSSNIFSGALNGNKSSMGMTHKNQSMMINPQNKSTLKLTKFFMQNRSTITNPKSMSQQLTLNEQLHNKQNIMGISNFGINPMSINLEKITKADKPIKEQCIEIYPVDETYLDGIVGEILCGDDD